MTDPRPFLPLVVLAVVLGAAALVASVAPSLVTTGVYQVWVDGVTITTESLSCQRLDDRSECSVPVGGRELAITVVRSDPRPIVPGACTAVHGDRRVSCTAQMADYGHASHSVRITEDLGLGEAELAAWRDRLPWWRTSEGLVEAGAWLTGLLALVVGGIAFLVGGRVRPRHPWRSQAAIGTGVLGLVLFGVAAQLAGAETGAAVVSLFVPPTLLAATVVAGWQWRLGSTSGGTALARWDHAATAIIATVVYSVIAVFVLLLLYSGFID
ncbi:hypothetical protein [Umezawaea sp. NPDC059074]|uniref:hypothetical protein n=1 Tax=Umezawaea sp. NPDC059074 TaxID=3346716 RepID=UPI0036C1DCB7